jgi:hypothetical protein
LPGNGDLEHMAIFCITDRVNAAPDDNVRIVARRPQRRDSADRAHRRICGGRVDTEVTDQNERQAV